MLENKTQYNFKPDEAIFEGHDNILIAVDGIDGSGKTTVVNILNKILTDRGYPTTKLRITQSGNIAKAVSDFCIKVKNRRDKMDETIFLAALQASTIEECVFPELEKGNNVIIDRWLPSYYGYQVVANGHTLADMIFREHLNNRYGNTDTLKTADLYIYCYTDVEMSNHRIQNDKTRQYETFDYVSNLVKDLVIRGYDIYYDAFVGNKIILDTRFLSIDQIECMLRDLIDSSGLEESKPQPKFEELEEHLKRVGLIDDPERYSNTEHMNKLTQRVLKNSVSGAFGDANVRPAFSEPDKTLSGKGSAQWGNKTPTENKTMEKIFMQKHLSKIAKETEETMNRLVDQIVRKVAENSDIDNDQNVNVGEERKHAEEWLKDMTANENNVCCGDQIPTQAEIIKKIAECRDIEKFREKMDALMERSDKDEGEDTNDTQESKHIGYFVLIDEEGKPIPWNFGVSEINRLTDLFSKCFVDTEKTKEKMDNTRTRSNEISEDSTVTNPMEEQVKENAERDKKIAEGMAILDGMENVYKRNTVRKPHKTQERYTKLVPIVGEDLYDLIVNQKVVSNYIDTFFSLDAKTYDKKLVTELDVRLSPFIRREKAEAFDHFATETNWDDLFTDECNGAKYNIHTEALMAKHGFTGEFLTTKPHIRLSAGEMILGKTIEVFSLPNDVIADFSLRSWAARSGINQSTSLRMKPNWTGQLVLELHNALRHHDVYLESGAVIGQVNFFRLGK